MRGGTPGTAAAPIVVIATRRCAKVRMGAGEIRGKAAVFSGRAAGRSLSAR
jgi:hypothetical protein